MPIYVTAGDVAGAATRVNAAVRGLELVFAVPVCTQKLDAGTRGAFVEWARGWRKWFNDNGDPSWYAAGLPALGNQVVAYENEVKNWQSIASQTCGAQLSPFKVETDVANENLDASFFPTTTSGKALLAGVVVIALLVLVKR